MSLPFFAVLLGYCFCLRCKLVLVSYFPSPGCHVANPKIIPFLRDSCRVSDGTIECLVVPSGIGGAELDQIQKCVQGLEGCREVYDGVPVVLASLLGGLFDKVHFLEELLGSSYGGQVVGCLGLIQPKGVGQQIHARFHVVPDRIANLLSLAVSVLFGALAVDVLSLGLDDDQACAVYGSVVQVCYNGPCHEEVAVPTQRISVSMSTK
jgi:hypothetical protein